ncbi:hypothetical protein DERP_000890, partial [Dermatophagoides pteronyssinus]
VDAPVNINNAFNASNIHVTDVILVINNNIKQICINCKRLLLLRVFITRNGYYKKNVGNKFVKESALFKKIKIQEFDSVFNDDYGDSNEIKIENVNKIMNRKFAIT